MRDSEKEYLYGEPEETAEEALEPELQLSRQEQRWIIMGALKSALLIGGIYIVGGALLIWILLAIWT